MGQNTITKAWVYVYASVGAKAIYCTFSLHAYCQTLLEAAGRTTFPLWKVHRAALLFCTDVVLVILHWAFKEALQTERYNVHLLFHSLQITRQCRIHLIIVAEIIYLSLIVVDYGCLECTIIPKHLMVLLQNPYFFMDSPNPVPYLAAFTSEQPIVVSRHFVSTDRTALLWLWSAAVWLCL